MLRFPPLAAPLKVGPLSLGVPLLLAPAMSLAAELPPLPQGPSTSVDAPAPYRYLDWVNREDIDLLPESQRPKHSGVCPGYYLPPVVVPREPVTDDTKAPLEASAEHYDMVGESQVQMRGDVVVQQGGRMIESDALDLDTSTKKAHLQDNVRVRQQGMLMTGQSADIDFNSKQLSVDEAEYVIHANHIRGSASRIHNTMGNVLVLDRSTYTTCEPNANTWYFEAEKLRLNAPKGWGTARNMVIRVKDVPVFYLPWFMFPIDDRRQSGFLFPTIGTSTTGGLELGIPYYLNLAPNYDATLTPVYMSKRGTLLNSEFRYLTKIGKGDFGGGYLDRDELYDGEKRYYGFWHHNSKFGDGWTAGVDYNKVSDEDYFIDIDSDLNSSALTHLNQAVSTSYRTDHWAFQGLVQQFQTLDSNIADANEPYRRVPQLRAFGGDLIGEDTGAYWFLGTEAVVFQHPHNDTRKPADAQRLTLSPGVGYQFENAYSYVNPRLRSVSTQYDITPGGALTAEELATFDETPDINTYIASLDSGLIFERETEWFETGQTQTLEPRAFLLYVPREREQVFIPRFDTASYSFSYDQLFRENRFTGGDRYGDEKKLSLGLTSRLISDDSGEEWLRLSVGQAFYFAHRYVQLSSRTERDTAEYSPLAGRVVWQLGKSWFFYNDIEWDADTNDIDNMNTGFQINRDNEYVLNVGYLYHEMLTTAVDEEDEDEPLKQSDVSFILPLSARWSALGRWGYDIELDRSFDNLVGLEYDSCCWKFRVVNRRFLQEDPQNEDEVKPKAGLYFQIELKGLASTSKKADTLLESGISGYRDREDQRKYRF